jgi:AmmeMemoRadiSam system protein A
MNPYAQLAKSAIEEYVRHRKIMDVPKNLPPEFYSQKGGVFVSLHKGNKLRGCIGTYLPVHKNLAEEIILNAIAACSRDNRFSPLSPEELPELKVEVSLLSSPKKISSLAEIDPQKYGVIVRCSDGRTGLLLPNLEGIDSAEKQLSIACQKGGINPAFDKNLEIYIFTTQKYEE